MATITSGRSALWGTNPMTINGGATPSVKLRADVSAACNGLARTAFGNTDFVTRVRLERVMLCKLSGDFIG